MAMMLDGLPTAGDRPAKPAAPRPEPKPLPKVDSEIAGLDVPLLGAAHRSKAGKSMPVSWAPKLVAVMDTGRGRIATIESGGEATTVAVGDRMAIGAISEIGAEFVIVGGKTLYLDQGVIAMSNPDAQDPASLTGGKAPTKQGGMPPTGPIMPPGFGGAPY